jgi:hypothetical protein
LLRAGQDLDGVGELAVGGQRALGIAVGAQDVRQDKGIARIGTWRRATVYQLR